MIRFVDLRWQGTGFRFAFWDTVNDTFLTISAAQAWDTVADLKGDLAAEYGQDLSNFHAWIERLTGLCPDWAHLEPVETGDDHDEQFGFTRPGGQ